MTESACGCSAELAAVSNEAAGWLPRAANEKSTLQQGAALCSFTVPT